MTVESFFPGVLLGYLGSFALYFINFERRIEVPFGPEKKLLALSLAAHFVLLLSILSGRRGALGPAEDIYAATFLVLALSFAIESKYRVRYLSLFSLPITLLFGLAAIGLSQKRGAEMVTMTSAPWLWVHLALILSGFACFLTAASAALMYLLQSYQLKSKHLGKVFLKLPALETLDRLHFRTLATGVVLFSFGVLSGLFRAHDLNNTAAQLLKDPKVPLSILTCFLYWLVLGLRFSGWRRGYRITAGTLLIFLLLLVTWMVSYYLPTALHKGI